MQCGANGIWDESGCFVYEVVCEDRVLVRSSPSNWNFHVVQNLYFEHGEWISVDLIRHSREDTAQQQQREGPFLRLSDGSGWILAKEQNRDLVKRILVEEEPIEDDQPVWTFRADNLPKGVDLLRHPVEHLSSKENLFPPDEGGRTFRPMQEIVCDRKVQCSNNGSNFFRVQGTCGWVLDRTQRPGNNHYRQLIIPSRLVEPGLFAFRILAPDGLQIRKACHVGDGSSNLTSANVQYGEIVIASLVRQSPLNNGNGPFVRLSDGSGWLFQHQQGRRLLEEVPVQSGRYELCLQRPTRPRGQPLQDYFYQNCSSSIGPQLQPGDTVVCDRKVTNPNTRVTWYRQKDTDFWIWDKETNDSDTESESIVSSIISEGPPEIGVPTKQPWSLAFVRGNANAIGGLEEVKWEPQGRVLSFRSIRDGVTILHIHLDTRTIGQMIESTLGGRRQEFHRNCSDTDLKELLMLCPGRCHKRARSSLPPSPIPTRWLPDEDDYNGLSQQQRLVSPDATVSNSDIEQESVREDTSRHDEDDSEEFNAEYECRRNLIDCQRQIRNLLYRQGNLLRSLQLHEEEKHREALDWKSKTEQLLRYQRQVDEQEHRRQPQLEAPVPPRRRRNTVTESMLVGSIVGGFVGLSVSPLFGPWIVDQLGLQQWLLSTTQNY